ncbi:MAG: hypothetical protein HY026_04140 [Deltaproteobacteria bacterium]|nr:hypothetical protein [Deltaproteobacteria bacterium]
MDNIGLPALLGVIVGASITYLYNMSLEQRKAQRERVNLAKLLLADIETLWDRYYQVLGNFIEGYEDLETPPTLTCPLNQNYFVIFDSNATKIGMFEPEAANKVVRLYTLAKTYLDTIRGYEERIKEYKKWNDIKKTPNNNQGFVVDDNLKQIFSELQITFQIIKQEHDGLKGLLAEVKEALKNISIK